jgi:hypothetical protein
MFIKHPMSFQGKQGFDKLVTLPYSIFGAFKSFFQEVFERKVRLAEFIGLN